MRTRFLQSDKLWNIVAALLAVHMFTFPFADELVLTHEQGKGLDSWKSALSYLPLTGKTWGTDIIFTYGPLGFLSSRIGWGISGWVFLLFDLFIIVNFFFIFRDFILQSGQKLLAFLILFCLIGVMTTFFGADLSFVLSFFALYWMYKSYGKPRAGYFAMIILLVTLSFFIKLNTGLVILVLLMAHLFNLAWFKKISYLKAAIIALLTAAAIFLSAALLHVSVASYIKGSMEMIKGYNDIMYLTEAHRREAFFVSFIFYAMLALYLGYAYLLIRKKQFGEVIFCLLCLLYIFILRKQSVIRNDVEHLSEFFLCAPLLLLIGNLFTLNGRVRKLSLAVIGLFTLVVMFIKTYDGPLYKPFARRFTNGLAYVRQAEAYDPQVHLLQRDKRYIPAGVLQKIGQETVDIFPWDAEYAFQNRLNYAPRPIFQSYSAYTPYLQQKNYEFYLRDAPRFVLYDYEAIDGRHPFNDECILNLFLVKNYSIVDSFFSNERPYLLLKKNAVVTPLDQKKIKETGSFLNSEIDVAGSSFVRIDLRPSLKGKILSIWSRPSEVFIEYKAPEGGWRRYKTSGQLLAGGVLTGKNLFTDADFSQLFSPGNALPEVKTIRIVADPAYYASQMKVEYYQAR